MIKRTLKWIAAVLVGIALLIGFGLLYVREIWGGAYPSWYVSPSQSEYKVVVYDYAGVLAGSTAFALYGVDTDHQLFLGYLGMDDKPEWTPWNCNLHWTSDGTVIYSKDDDYRVAYSFDKNCLLIRRGLPQPPGSRRPVKFVDPTALASFMKEHGGEGVSFFNEFQETNLTWRDFIPSENN